MTPTAPSPRAARRRAARRRAAARRAAAYLVRTAWRRRLRRDGLALLVAASLAVPVTAVPTPPEEGATTSASPAAPAAAPELTVPRPDIGHLNRAVRDQIEGVQARLEQLLAQEPRPTEALVTGFGFLGQLLSAFSLFDAAETAFEGAAALSDEFMWPYYLGLAAHSKGDFPTAVARYREALERSPGYTAARIRLGDALLEMGRLDEAAAAYDSVLEVAPQNASALRGAGEAALRAGDAEGAVRFLERALAEAPGADSLHYPLAQAYRRLGDDALATRHLARQGEMRVPLDDPLAGSITQLGNTASFAVAGELAEEEPFSELNFLGFVGARLRSVPGAVEQLEDLIQHVEGSAEGAPTTAGRLRWAQAELLLARGDAETAEAHLRRALELASGLVHARVTLADLLARQERFAEALPLYSAALERDPDHREARVRRAAVLTRLSRFDEALAELAALQERSPDDVELRIHAGSVLEQSDRAEAAREAYRSVVEEGRTRQERAQGHLALAGMARRAGDLAAAEAAFRAARELDPALVAAVAGEAGLLGARGAFAEAAALYRQAVELDPDNEEHRRAEATALVLGGEHAAVVARLEEGLVRFPDSIVLQEILARHLAASPDPSVRDGERAVELATRVYEAKPAPVSLETLAMAHAEAGDFEQAVAWQERLLESVDEYEGTSEYYRLRANLELYRQGRPCCATP